jgi:hypothetical protein
MPNCSKSFPPEAGWFLYILEYLNRGYSTAANGRSGNNPDGIDGDMFSQANSKAISVRYPDCALSKKYF